MAFTEADPVDEGGTARFAFIVEPALSSAFSFGVTYTAGTAGLEDLGSDRPTIFQISANTSD